MEENLEKIEFTEHILERYVERTMDKSGNEIKQFLAQNEEQVRQQILKLYQYSACKFIYILYNKVNFFV